MCNAWNHPIGCTCGWGGEGHLGQRTQFDFNRNRLLLNDKTLIQSYVNPNAKCPVCGENVFFYKSENGGRVYFDELGPPWTKHPCTDTSNFNNYTKTNFIDYIILPYDTWKRTDIFPVKISSNSIRSLYSFVLTRIDNYNSLDVMIYGTYSTEVSNKNKFLFVKRLSVSTLLLSGYNTDNFTSFEVELSQSQKSLDSFFS